MAEIKNSFLKSIMNQDLDDRLIPNGEYREALNMSVGKSEGSDIGTLQNILGNSRVGAKNRIVGNECIGYFMDNANNCIYQFLTNEGDNQTDPISNQITVYNFTTQTNTVLVDGIFLNFLKDYPITAINLVENLLFWTDYNNQPRKINVSLANPNKLPIPTYYTTEEQISVAKYAPVEAISLVKTLTTTVTAAVSNSATIFVSSVAGISVGMTVISGSNIEGKQYVTVESIGVNFIQVSENIILLNSGDILTLLISTMSDESENPDWPGDPAYLKARYVRFSYRFRLDDGEYTLMAPFTQIAYIPNQKGYFIEGDETDAYTSTVLKWFENNVNNIKLLIPFPDVLSKVNQSYKIQSLDILYKESDSLAINVIETIPYGAFSANTLNNIYEYDYQSRKPYKTLTEDQTTRVYDMVPVKALAQESSGNRIIYGNFLKNHTAPKSLNYQVSAAKKQDTSLSFIEYPNHTLKQNRTYQVGFILSDKYGRQSSVILSSLDTKTSNLEGNTYGGSTIFSPYYSSSSGLVPRNWFGNALSVLVNDPISSSTLAPGEPGLYAQPTSSTGFTLTGTTTITDSTYTFSLAVGSGPAPLEGDYLRGEYTDYVKIESINSSSPYTATTTGRVNDLYTRNLQNDPKDIKYAYSINALGWYSYKIVVRQQEQDYYNVYLPGMLNGYPKGQTYGSQVNYINDQPALENGINITDFPLMETNKVTHTVLINDNINKIPRDLVEVGPDQKLYRSSVQLFCRVENTMIIDNTTSKPNNKQYFPSKKADTAIAIATSTDLGFLPSTVENLKGSARYNFYQLETQPLIARISTANAVGFTAVKNDDISPGGIYPSNVANMLPYLGVYETKPVYSLLDIFWETSSTGLISDLNEDVLTGFDGAVGLSDITWSFLESANPLDATKFITNEFWPESNTGIPINSSGVTLTVKNGNNNFVDYFGISATTVNPGNPVTEYKKYRLYIKDSVNGIPFKGFAFIYNTALTSFVFTISLLTGSNLTPTSYVTAGRVGNVTPNILLPLGPTAQVLLDSPTPTGDPFFTFTVENGANDIDLRKQDLFWDIQTVGSTTDFALYFSIETDPGTSEGKVYLNAPLPLVPTSFNLNIRVRDAMSSAGLSTIDSNALYSTKEDVCLLNVALASIHVCDRDWTGSNYTGTKYTDDTPIPQVTSPAEWEALTTGAWCYYNNSQANEAIYGKIYNGYAIQGIWSSDPNDRKTFAPNEFRVPYTTEVPAILSCATAGNLKQAGTYMPGTGLWLYPNTGGDNSTGFSGLPGGWRLTNGQFSGLHENAGFHLRQGLSGYGAWGLRWDSATDKSAPGGTIDPRLGYSVRFVDDQIQTRTANLPFGSDSCSTTYNNATGIPVTINLDINGLTSQEFTTIEASTITGSCSIS